VIDILILSNGPGEVSTWVRPVVKALRQQFGENSSQVRISVVLSPCNNATGNEPAVALSYPEVNRVQGAEHFFPFLLWGKTANNWDWADKGVVLFLGGDQFFPLVISKRLGFKSVIYAEWEARWYRWIDGFGVMKPELITKLPQKYHYKCEVVGDLMAEASHEEASKGKKEEELIGLLPGSKAAKLTLGVPFCLAIADYIHRKRPLTRFVIPVAPTLDITALAKYGNPQANSLIPKTWGVAGKLVTPTGDNPYLLTSGGTKIYLATHFPAYDILSQCALCLTTVGANTAELGSLAVPMIILIPTQKLDTMRSWDGIPGILANLPFVGSGFATLINWLVVQNLGLRAWPNIWAGKEIVPELVGELQPEDVGKLALDWLENPGKLEKISQDLRSVRGKAGAAHKLAQLVVKNLGLSALSNK
jgi:lipid-A-disaccharide synthase